MKETRDQATAEREQLARSASTEAKHGCRTVYWMFFRNHFTCFLK